MSCVIYYVPIIGIPLDYRRGQFGLTAAIVPPTANRDSSQEVKIGPLASDAYYPVPTQRLDSKQWVVISITQLFDELPYENALMYREEDNWVYTTEPSYTVDRSPHQQMCAWNAASLLPILNIMTAFQKFYEATQSLEAFEKEDRVYIRILLVVVGVLELTLIGAWIAHGIATAYFKFSSPPSHQEMLEASAKLN